MSINRVIVSGRLGADAELRATSGGTEVLSFRLAVNDRVKSGTEWVDHTNWVGVVVFGRRAGALAPLLVKGAKVAVEGKLRFSEWAEAGGGRRSKLEIVADVIELLSRTGGRAATSEPEDDGEEIPF